MPQINISADFTIIDNNGQTYSNEIEVRNTQPFNLEKQVREKISSVYNVKDEQIIEVKNIDTYDAFGGGRPAKSSVPENNLMVYAKHKDDRTYKAMDVSKGVQVSNLLYASLIPPANLQQTIEFIDGAAKDAPDFSFEIRETGTNKVWHSVKGGHEDEQPVIRSVFSLGNQSAEVVAEEKELAPLVEVPEVNNFDLFFNGEWFKHNPDKILGEAYTASGRFGQVTKYRGDIGVLSKIDVPNDFIGANKLENNPLLSSTTEINVSAEIMKPDVEQHVKEVIEISEAEVGKKVNRAKKIEAYGLIDAEVQTFHEIYEKYNQGITRDELEAYIWYKTEEGKPLSRLWVSLLDRSVLESGNPRETMPYHASEEKINHWVKTGVVYFFDGQLVPAYRYLSGNVYEKRSALEREQEKIKEKYGAEVFEAQKAALDEAFRVKYQRRLTITGSKEGLTILATSKFAKTFEIERIEDMDKGASHFLLMPVTAASKDNYGRPDFQKDMQAYGDYNRNKYETLNLSEAFCYWLTRIKPELKQPVTHWDIVKVYVQTTPPRLQGELTKEQVKIEKAKIEKVKSMCQLEGERLFAIFLNTQLGPNDRVRLETQWNMQYNNYLPVDTLKIPVAFTMCKFYKGKPEHLKPEKREAVAFIMDTGSGCLAYDVGVGKTPSSIFTMSAFIDAGWTKRPFVCVPNQVYKQFISEIKGFAPHIPVVELYNLSAPFIEKLAGGDLEDVKDFSEVLKVPLGAISVMTYEGLEQIGFNETTQGRMMTELYEILNQGGESERPQSAKQKEGFQARLETLMGKSLKGTRYNIEDFGFDFGCYDEAHKMKKVFTAVKGEMSDTKDGSKKRDRNPYQINSGTPSSIALKGFMLNQYIQKQNRGQNVLLLTATPFTNSPLEIFSMLSMIAYSQLQNTDLNNIKNFFDTYVATSTELVMDSKMRPVFKQVIMGFNNLISMQTLIRRYINYKTGEDVNVIRPKKYVLPLTKKVDGETVLTLDEHERIDTFIPMTGSQKAMMDDIISYVEGKTSLGELESNSAFSADTSDDETADTTEIVEVDESILSDNEKAGVRTIKGLSYARNLSLSPYLYEHSGLGKPTYMDYIETSPKLTYVVRCVESVKRHHETRNTPMSGQVIYMDRGIEYFELIREYLIKEVGFKPHEVAIIKSGMPKEGKKSKEYIKNLFLGTVYNEKTKEYEPIGDDDRVKVIIGSSTIKEGINLQVHGSVLYNCFLDWNPTDIVQLEGRIWRQGNLYNSVRIVNPLVVDSADIFIFQKLQEKTSRLNSIWSTDNKSNAINTNDFDPKELKFALIRDPKVVAELMVIEEKNQLEGELMGEMRLIEQAESMKTEIKSVLNKLDDAVDTVQEYRDFTLSGDTLADCTKMVQLIAEVERSQKDKQGRKMLGYWEQRESKLSPEEISDKRPFEKPYWFSYFSVSVRQINKMVKDFVIPRDLPFSMTDTTWLDEFILQVEEKKKAIEQAKTQIDSNENKAMLVQQVIDERAAKNIVYKSVQQAVGEFATLNHLLDDKKVVLEIPKETPKVDRTEEPAGSAKELDSLQAEKIRLVSKALKRMPGSKKQKEVIEEIAVLDEKIKAVEEEATPVIEHTEPVDLKAQISEQINALKIAAKYAGKEDQETINQQIKALTISLKYA